MPNNYPPGVTGNESQITGEIEFDPHAPFWAGKSPDWAVFFRNEEDPMFIQRDGYYTWDEQEAEWWAKRLNIHYALRDPETDERTGQCRVCGDLHGYPPGPESESSNG